MASREIQSKMLEELQKIRAAVEPKPAPPTPAKPPKGFVEEFMEFLNKYGIVGLAIAFIIGGAAGRLVTALVSDIIMPIITFFIPGGEWRKLTLQIGPIVFGIGDFIGSLIDFTIIALIVYMLSKQISKIGLK
ncbi:MAG: MscL family protein [Candidatus Bathyarchaeia archaeon]